MPFSTGAGKPESKEFLVSNLPENASILDVGAGSGTYAKLLADTEFVIDAVEAWPNYIEQYNLNEQYQTVYQQEIQTFDYPKKYDAVIFGDVLEHLSVAEAQATLAIAMKNSNIILISIPWESPQGEYKGCHYEIHKQSDVTPELFSERYPEFKLLSKHRIVGVYYYKAEL